MVTIDYIMDLLDWNQSEEEQAKGRELAREVRSLKVFLRPNDQYHNKNVWNNCALILSERSDEELRPYLYDLTKWLEDMNWPGAFCILERLNNFSDYKSLSCALKLAVKYAKAEHLKIWRKNLKQIKIKK